MSVGQVGNLAGRDPPAHRRRLAARLEPLASSAQVHRMAAAEHEVLQRLEVGPHRHVDDRQRVVLAGESHEAGRLTVVVLQPPHEPGRRLGQCVDRPECQVELRRLVGVERMVEPRDVELPRWKPSIRQPCHRVGGGMPSECSTHGPTPLMRSIFTCTTTLVGESCNASGDDGVEELFANRSIAPGSGRVIWYGMNDEVLLESASSRLVCSIEQHDPSSCRKFFVFWLVASVPNVIRCPRDDERPRSGGSRWVGCRHVGNGIDPSSASCCVRH